MEEAAWGLPKNRQVADARDIYFLTGAKHWYQTAFCVHTFDRHSVHAIRPIILDDGSLGDKHLGKLREIAPNLSVRGSDECFAKFCADFPVVEFRNLHKWRERQLLFRKLVDIHSGSSEQRLFFDSDMLFFDNPAEIDSWLYGSDSSIFQTDCWESYGYSRALAEYLCGHALPERVNIGVFSLNGSRIDWGQVEHWLGELERAEGSKYNVTQCICAMLMASERRTRLPYDRYPVLPTSIGASRKPPLQHYVADAKPLYFGRAWQEAVNDG